MSQIKKKLNKFIDRLYLMLTFKTKKKRTTQHNDRLNLNTTLYQDMV